MYKIYILLKCFNFLYFQFSDFSNSLAKSKKWSTKKMDRAKPIFATKLTEMKKKYNEGKLQD